MVGITVSTAGWREERRSGIAAKTAYWSGVRMVRHNGQHGRLEKSEHDPVITVSTAGWMGVRRGRQNYQNGRLESSEDGRA